MDYVAGLLGVSSAHVEGVATFYSMLRRKPLGKYRIQICRSISCGITGCDKILVHLKNKLGIDLCTHYASSRCKQVDPSLLQTSATPLLHPQLKTKN